MNEDKNKDKNEEKVDPFGWIPIFLLIFIFILVGLVILLFSSDMFDSILNSLQ